jgi:superfamily I DNA/RNA helicase/RecB family exonuclease
MTSPHPGLDTAQRAVVQLPPEASGVVIGAPGTGKTRALVDRVRRLLAVEGGAGLLPEQVLVLTPTRQTATALRDRLAVVADRATSGALARSMSAFAFQVVRAAAVHAGDEPPVLLSAPDQDRIIAELLEGDAADAQAGLPSRWPAGLDAGVRASRSFRGELRALFAECGELGVGPERLAQLGRARRSDEWVAAASFLSDYRFAAASMRAAHRDPADLLREAAALLGGAGGFGAAPIGPAAALRAVLVDDAQELTRGGLAVLRALRARGVAVLAFGDPDIASGAFRGASPELFARLCDALGTVHVFERPHRATPALTRLGREITAAIGASGRIEHRRPPGPVVPDAGVRTILAPSAFEQIDLIARTLREWHLLDDIPWSQMAVMAHDTRQVAELEAELGAREVPTRAASVPRPLGAEPVVRDLVGIVRLGIAPPDERDPDALMAALRSPFGALDAVGLRRLRARLRHAELAAEGTRPARELLREAMSRPLELALIDTPEARAAERLALSLQIVHDDAARGATVHELLWTVWNRARDAGGRSLARAWHEAATSHAGQAAETGHALDALVALFDAAKRAIERSPDERPESFIHRILDSDVPEDTLTAPERPETVRLLTPAAALGTEFEAVVVAGVQDGVWPNVRVRGGLLGAWRLADDLQAWREGDSGRPESAVLDRRRAALHDELRLLVRAISRARSRLVVTAVDDDDLGPSPFLSFLPEPGVEIDALPGHPITLRGLVAEHRRTLTASTSPAARAHAAGQLVVLAREGVPGAAVDQWYGMAAPTSTGPLRDPARGPVHVSPSRLEGFETCALDWAIRALGGDTRSWSAGVGTILHAALEEVPGGEEHLLQAVVDRRWGELDFEAPWMGEKERAWATELVGRLHAYLARFHREQGRTLGAEARFRIAVDMDARSETGEPVVRALADGGSRDDTAGARLALLSGSVDRVEVYPDGHGEEVPYGEGGRERVMIVDLKTGRSETRVSDEKVEGDPQLAAYQLALLEGLIPGADPAANAGARLLVLSKTLKNTRYRLARQAPLDAAGRARFLDAIVAVAEGMASHVFEAKIDAHCNDDRFAVCRVHTVKAVSAS